MPAAAVKIQVLQILKQHQIIEWYFVNNNLDPTVRLVETQGWAVHLRVGHESPVL